MGVHARWGEVDVYNAGGGGERRAIIFICDRYAGQLPEQGPQPHIESELPLR